MAYWHISKLIKRLYPGVIWHQDQMRKVIYFTFDDGPTPIITERVLDQLELYQAKGTFFCLGRNVERHPDVYDQIISRGHGIGNHTYSHLKGWKTDNDSYFSDIQLAAQFINSNLFRPPYGQISRSQIRQLKDTYKIVMWDVMSHDYEGRLSKERSLKAILRYTKNGSILVFHDSLKAWPKLEYILPRILEHFSDKGFTFEKLAIT